MTKLPSLKHSFCRIKRIEIYFSNFRSDAESNDVSWCGGKSLKFVKPPGPITGLISFPISGSTWLRHLIQEATGKITGSFYKSNLLRENGFPGERIYNGSAIVVKTHLTSS